MFGLAHANLSLNELNFTSLTLVTIEFVVKWFVFGNFCKYYLDTIDQNYFWIYIYQKGKNLFWK